MTKGDYKKLNKALTVLHNIRLALHWLRGKDDNRLLFEYQRTIAQSFGFEAKKGKHAVERFMRLYYRSSAEIKRINALVMQSIWERLAPHQQTYNTTQIINARFQFRLGMIEVRSTDVFKRYPVCFARNFLPYAKMSSMAQSLGKNFKAYGG